MPGRTFCPRAVKLITLAAAPLVLTPFVATKRFPLPRQGNDSAFKLVVNVPSAAITLVYSVDIDAAFSLSASTNDALFVVFESASVPSAPDPGVRSTQRAGCGAEQCVRSASESHQALVLLSSPGVTIMLMRGTNGVPRKGLNIGQHEGLNL